MISQQVEIWLAHQLHWLAHHIVAGS